MAGFGFDITEAKAGAEAVTDILAQPAALEQKKAEAETAKATARIKSAEVPYEEAKYKGLMEYMKGAKPGDAGREFYGNLKNVGEIQQRTQRLQQEQARLDQTQMDPQSKAAAQTSLDRQQKELDTLQEKHERATAKQMGEVAAVLSKIDTPEQLQGAFNYFQTESAAAADAAIQEGTIPAESRAAFIADRMRGSGLANVNPQTGAITPKPWNETTKAAITAKAEGGMTQAERLKEQHEETYRQKALAEVQKQTKQTERLARAEEIAPLKIALPQILGNTKDATKALQDIMQKDTSLSNTETKLVAQKRTLEKLLQENTKIETHWRGPDTKKIDPSFKDLPDEIAALDEDIKKAREERKDLKPKLEETEKAHKDSVLQSNIVLEKLGVKPLPKSETAPKVVPPPKEDKAETEHGMSDKEVIAQMKAHLPGKSDEDLRTIAIKEGYIKAPESKKPSSDASVPLLPGQKAATVRREKIKDVLAQATFGKLYSALSQVEQVKVDREATLAAQRALYKG